MIIKSNGSIEIESAEIEDIVSALQGLNLPEGAKLCSFSEKREMTEPYDSCYVLTFEWEVEV